jgi:hypothetical protein
LNQTDISSRIDRLEAQGLIDTESKLVLADGYLHDESFSSIINENNLPKDKGGRIKITLTSYGRAFMEAVT